MEEPIKGAARLRAAVENQADAGETCFMLPLADARKLAAECGEELEFQRGQIRDAFKLYYDLKIDLGDVEENPEHYEGDGVVSCSRAMRSMCDGWEYSAEEPVPLSCAYWAVTAFKYLWRFPLKGHPREDLMKAIDCAQRALDAWER